MMNQLEPKKKMLHSQWDYIISNFGICHKYLVPQRILAGTKNLPHCIQHLTVSGFVRSGFEFDCTKHRSITDS